ncbi:hypothetical protein GZ77_26310 [Endozoicomonas montiporae]|uniref:Plasmid replication protein RepB n=1 Tax=Endozoicomonas montiporae TaxID=1027273 RepID=A0A081MYJ3_9GAMM|nr:hypothetical protein [Endozoicomonas montiporae]KEQ11266.1 hypothetical protein GZ77_26310 [Endozoicomonas montiporae]
MRIDQIALLMQAGDISTAYLLPAPLKDNKWTIQFERKNGEQVPLTAQRANVRHFSSLDSAWKILIELGFSSAVIRR